MDPVRETVVYVGLRHDLLILALVMGVGMSRLGRVIARWAAGNP